MIRHTWLLPEVLHLIINLEYSCLHLSLFITMAALSNLLIYLTLSAYNILTCIFLSVWILSIDMHHSLLLVALVLQNCIALSYCFYLCSWLTKLYRTKSMFLSAKMAYSIHFHNMIRSYHMNTL